VSVPGGNDKLSSIRVSLDFPVDEEMACDPTDDDDTRVVEARLRGDRTDNPFMVLCPSAFTHGGIDKGYGKIPFFNVPKVSCENFGSRVSWKMDTLGSTIMHEYMHYVNLHNPPFPGRIRDIAWGPFDVRNMNKKDAIYNADSYTWFAIENLWSVLCVNLRPDGYEDPVDEDANDPSCGLSACIR
jgi:hypothetical protein